VVGAAIADGLIPSFCTACYRMGRTGEGFMDLAKPGDIHEFCRPNALLTFAEYLEDYGDEELKKGGNSLIKHVLDKISNTSLRGETQKRLAEIHCGKRDLFF
jgi:2-iminoacetate synthase